MNNDEQEIRQLVTTWMEATKNGDTDTVLSLMTDDAVFLIAGQPPMLGKKAFEAALNAQPASGNKRPTFDGQSEIQEVKILGDWAFMWTRLKVTVTLADGSASIVRTGYTLSILRKQDGLWKLARDANMLAPPPN